MQPFKQLIVEEVSIEKFDWLCQYAPYEVTLNFEEDKVDPMDVIDYCIHTFGKQDRNVWRYGFHSRIRVTIYLKSKTAADNFPLLAKMNWNINNTYVGDVRKMPRGLVPYRNF